MSADLIPAEVEDLLLSQYGSRAAVFTAAAALSPDELAEELADAEDVHDAVDRLVGLAWLAAHDAAATVAAKAAHVLNRPAGGRLPDRATWDARYELFRLTLGDGMLLMWAGSRGRFGLPLPHVDVAVSRTIDGYPLDIYSLDSWAAPLTDDPDETALVGVLQQIIRDHNMMRRLP